jgi:hypothetical protein
MVIFHSYVSLPEGNGSEIMGKFAGEKNMWTLKCIVQGDWPDQPSNISDLILR